MYQKGRLSAAFNVISEIVLYKEEITIRRSVDTSS